MTTFAQKKQLLLRYLIGSQGFIGKSNLTFNPVLRDMKCSGFWKNCRETGTSGVYNTSFMSSCHHFVALYKMHFCLCRNFGVMTSSYGHNKMHSFLRGNLNVLYNIQMIRLWTNHIQFRMRYRKIMWSYVPNVPNPSWQCFCSETMKKSTFCGLKVPRLSKWLAAESIPYQSQERDAQSLDFCIKDNHFFQTLLPSFQLDTF